MRELAEDEHDGDKIYERDGYLTYELKDKRCLILHLRAQTSTYEFEI
jgi:hypothetical protein